MIKSENFLSQLIIRSYFFICKGWCISGDLVFVQIFVKIQFLRREEDLILNLLSNKNFLFFLFQIGEEVVGMLDHKARVWVAQWVISHDHDDTDDDMDGNMDDDTDDNTDDDTEDDTDDDDTYL